MSQDETSGHLLARLQNVWSPRSTKVVPLGYLNMWGELQNQAILELRGLRPVNEETDNFTRADQIQMEVMAALRGGWSVRGGPRVTVRSLNMGSIRRDRDEVIKELNKLVPYPRLTDKVKDLPKGLEAFLERGPRCLIRNESKLQIISMMSATICGDLLNRPKQTKALPVDSSEPPAKRQKLL
jgi:hypothetical protein